MGLIDLPTEVIQNIIEYNIPDDFGSIFLSCKTFREACQRYIPEHLARRDKYRHFSIRNHSEVFAEHTDEPMVDVALGLLLEIAVDPIVARYVEHADFSDDMGTYSFDTVWAPGYSDGRNTQERYIEGVEDLFWDSIIPSMFDDHVNLLYADGLRSDLANPSATLDFCFVLLLTLLPNLKELCLPHDWAIEEPDPRPLFQYFLYILDGLVGKANREGAAGEIGLAKLKKLLPTFACGYESRYPLQTLVPLLPLRSLEEVCVGSAIAVDDDPYGFLFDPESRILGPNLKVLELHGAIIGPEEMKMLLADMPHLETLALTIEDKWHDLGNTIDWGTLLRAIEGSPASHSLKSLSLDDMLENRNGDCPPFRSFRNFRKLQELSLDIAFVQPYHWPCDDSGRPSASGEYGESSMSLIYMLPPTIQSFECFAEIDPSTIGMLMRLFSQSSIDSAHSLLPELKTVTVHANKYWKSSDYPEGVRRFDGDDLAVRGRDLDPERLATPAKEEFWDAVYERINDVPSWGVQMHKRPRESASLKRFLKRFKFTDRY